MACSFRQITYYKIKTYMYFIFLSIYHRTIQFERFKIQFEFVKLAMPEVPPLMKRYKNISNVLQILLSQWALSTVPSNCSPKFSITQLSQLVCWTVFHNCTSHYKRNHATTITSSQVCNLMACVYNMEIMNR